MPAVINNRGGKKEAETSSRFDFINTSISPPDESLSFPVPTSPPFQPSLESSRTMDDACLFFPFPPPPFYSNYTPSNLMIIDDDTQLRCSVGRSSVVFFRAWTRLDVESVMEAMVEPWYCRPPTPCRTPDTHNLIHHGGHWRGAAAASFLPRTDLIGDPRAQ